jgi:hypothetical protein
MSQLYKKDQILVKEDIVEKDDIVVARRVVCYTLQDQLKCKIEESGYKHIHRDVVCSEVKIGKPSSVAVTVDTSKITFENVGQVQLWHYAGHIEKDILLIVGR